MSAGPQSERIETGSVDVGGVRAFYRRLAGDGPPAVLIHGVPTHSEDWVPVLEAMRGPAIAMDLPGFGRSDRPPPDRFDYSMGAHGAFVRDFLEAMGVGEYSLCVHDWGGVGLIAAQREPGRVRRLVVINAVPFLPGYRWHRTARIWRTRGLGELSNRIWSRRFVDFSMRESRGDWSRQPSQFVDLIVDHLDRGTLDGILRLYRSAPPDELERAGAELDSLACPSLVVWGARDRYLPARFGRDYTRALDAELLELPEAGHWPWRDDPKVIPRIAGFLEPR